MKIAIIGGGISGLTTAFYLKANQDIQVDVYEKDVKLGGKMQTHYQNGFYFEYGTNGFLSNKPHTLELVKDANASDLLIKSNDLARIRYIYKDALHVMPESPKAFLKTPLLSFSGKLRVLCEPFIKAKKDLKDESLLEFGYRRLGKEFTDTFLDAMVAGVYASTPSEISLKSAFPMVEELEREYGGLFLGMIKKRKKSAGPGGILMSFKNGVSTFIEHLAKQTQANIYTNKKVLNIEKNASGYNICLEDKKEFYDKVVLCTPSFVSSLLVKNIDEKLATMLNGIEYSPISVVGFGYDKLNHDLNGFGLLSTSSSNLNILGVLWDSSVFSDRAKEGKKCLRVMIGGQRNLPLALKDEKTLIEFAYNDIKKTMNVDTKPDVVFVKKYEKGIPNYTLNHNQRMKNIFDILQKHKNLYLNSNAYFGIALNDCVKNSKQCALEILK